MLLSHDQMNLTIKRNIHPFTKGRLRCKEEILKEKESLVLHGNANTFKMKVLNVVDNRIYLSGPAKLSTEPMQQLTQTPRQTCNSSVVCLSKEQCNVLALIGKLQTDSLLDHSRRAAAVQLPSALAEATCIFSGVPAEVCQHGAVIWLYQMDDFSQGEIHQPTLKQV